MKKIFTTLQLVVFALCAYAQTYDVLPYEFSFEDSESAELANWVINPGCPAADTVYDRWAVGTALHSDGAKGMYISNDGGLTSNYGNDANPKHVQFAYRDFCLPTGNYYVSFDWICNDRMLYAGYVNYVPDAAGNPSAQAQKISFVTNSDQFPRGITPIAALNGEVTWHNRTYTLNVTQPTNGQVRYTRVYFAWANSERDSVEYGISAAIDNVQLLKAGCPIPTSFDGEVVDCDNVNFSWEGSSARYQFQYRKVGDENWRNRMVNNGEMTYTLQGMTEGQYDMRVRGVCYEVDSVTGDVETIFSPYAYISNFTVFCPELHCINYINIHDSVNVHCTYGQSASDYYSSLQAPFQETGCLDYGWESVNSRHTVVFDTLATDPRTNNQLRMVPQGYTASVRLGNWNYNAEAEAITYNYTVDADNSILLVNYAIVLEDPEGHGDDAMPRFIVEIRDEAGKELDAICGRVDLNPLNDDANWIHTQDATSSWGGEIVYKDWTTMGLNLDPYVGRTIQIRVITYDCFWSGHYGYAYFTMDCATARIKNTSCGNQQSMKVIAPVGFNYAWFTQGQLRSTDREVEILSTDPVEWVCTLTSTENADCSFDLTVNTTARFPQAECVLTYSPVNCENRYVVENTSYIWTNDSTGRTDHRDEVCDEFEWDFGIGDEGHMYEPNPGYITFPEEGGRFLVQLHATIGNGRGLCASDTAFWVDVPAIGETELTVDTTICAGTYIVFDGKRYFETGNYIIQEIDPVTGCLHNDRLNLTVRETNTTIMPDTLLLCYGDSVVYDGHPFYAYGSGNNQVINQLINRFGCDSTVVYPIYVFDKIDPEYTIQVVDNDHEFGSITLGGSGYDYYVYDGVRDAPLDQLEGGLYPITFYNDFGCELTDTVNVGGCLRNIVYQRWDDVISLKNKDYNGGYEFVSFQWYKDGEIIEGATKSYYYQPGGLTIDAAYTCQVVLTDGAHYETCPFYPEASAQRAPSVTPTYLNSGDMVTITVPENCTCVLYNTMGLRMASAQLTEGDNYLHMPLQSGVYVLNIHSTDMDRPYRLTVAE